MHKISTKWKIQPEDPDMVKPVVVGCLEKSEKKPKVQNISSEIMIEFLLKFRLRVHFHEQFAAMAIVL